MDNLRDEIRNLAREFGRLADEYDREGRTMTGLSEAREQYCAGKASGYRLAEKGVLALLDVSSS